MNWNALLSILALSLAPAVALGTEEPAPSPLYGHLKAQLLLQALPGDSLFRDLVVTPALDQGFETRLGYFRAEDGWDFRADYQFIAIHADTLPLREALPGNPFAAGAVIDDSRRWWDLTYRFGDGRTAMVHRLDRLSVGLTTERSAWRFGRQAISWGNGMLFTPMDVFNPFDPATIDKEYKTGDDMLYGQFLFANGSDLQGVAVVRRDPLTGRVERDQSSLAFKAHGSLGDAEFDLLAARHFGDDLLGLGGNVPVGGAVWRGDLTWTQTGAKSVLSVVTSLSYAWTWAGRNLSGLAEYYYNGFGQSGGRYAPDELLENPDLIERLTRGELFTLARHYMAASATVEMTPLLWLTPSMFVNLEDPSALAQLVAQFDLSQDLLLRAAVNLPIGPSGTEYGGIESPVPGRYFSSGPSLFVQLAWYF